MRAAARSSRLRGTLPAGRRPDTPGTARPMPHGVCKQSESRALPPWLQGQDRGRSQRAGCEVCRCMRRPAGSADGLSRGVRREGAEALPREVRDVRRREGVQEGRRHGGSRVHGRVRTDRASCRRSSPARVSHGLPGGASGLLPGVPASERGGAQGLCDLGESRGVQEGPSSMRAAQSAAFRPSPPARSVAPPQRRRSKRP